MICAFLTAATLAAFWQINYCDFNDIDDVSYVTGNTYIKSGITLEGITWAFTSMHASHWHPVTWLSHMLDVQLFGLKPQWHHLTNLLFHVANTLLLFLVFYRMTKALWQTAFVAVLFALHPLHVESVAWIAERKDVISTFFWMITMGAYVFYVERPLPRRYLAVLISFALGLMAKPMLITLPLVLLLMDYWPLKRFEQKKSVQESSTQLYDSVFLDNGQGYPKENQSRDMKVEEPVYIQGQWASIRPLLWEKIPLFILAVLSSVITYFAATGSATVSFEVLPLNVRVENAFFSYVFYIGKMIWPNNLAVFYPYPERLPLWQVLGVLALLAAVTMAVIWKMKHFPYLTVGWLWYIGTLVPVIGIVQVGVQARADRFTYIPLIGLFIMVAWGIPELLKNWRYRQEGLSAASALIISGLFIITWLQVAHWQNSVTLFEHALSVTNENYVAYHGRGIASGRMGNYGQAIEDFNRAIKINPHYAEAYYNRGNIYATIGNYQQAIENFNSAIQYTPRYAEVYFNRGNVYAALGNYQQAIENFNSAIQFKPQYAEAYCNRGAVNGRLSNLSEAIRDFDRAIEINKQYADAYNNRAIAYNSLGNSRQAVEDRKTAARLGNKGAQDFFRKHEVNWY